eukprot:CFRG4311T1
MTSSTSPGLKVVLGTMSFPKHLSDQDTFSVFENFKKMDPSNTEADTALIYGVEDKLGKVGYPGLKMACKAHPANSSLSRENVKQQLTTSLESLRTKKCDIFYLHQPDHGVPILETLQGVDDCFKAGMFTRLGLSNYASWEVMDIYHLCKENGFVLPTVYQGLYNCVFRMVEPELLPALRYLGISFYAFNPLAGGILTGRYKFEDDPDTGRFNKNSAWGVEYRKRYWSGAFFEQMDTFKNACAEANITPADAAIRWVVHHSQLKSEYGDAIIIGGSCAAHIEQNTKACQMGPIPENVCSIIDTMNEILLPSCPRYFRGASNVIRNE